MHDLLLFLAPSFPSLILNHPSLSLLPIQITSQDLPLAPREPVILSVGQFRPEKDHPLQIRAFARFLNSSSTGKNGHINKKDIKLVLLGSCRGAEDERRVEALRALAAEAGVGGQVEFVVGAPFPELKRWLGRASVGVHTMWNEHFGICVVEYMVSAGVRGGGGRERRKVQQSAHSRILRVYGSMYGSLFEHRRHQSQQTIILTASSLFSITSKTGRRLGHRGTQQRRAQS